MTFALDISKFIKKTDAKINQTVREVIVSVASSLVELSPVGQKAIWKNPKSAPKGYVGGHFRANWQHGFGSYSEEEIAAIDPGGQITKQRIKADVQAAPVAGKHYIVNNVPYAEALENGHSTQAPGPEAIVGKTILLFDRMAKAAGAA